MGMLSYAEKNVFNTGKSGGDKEGKDKDDNMADDPTKTKLSLVR